MTFAQQRNRLTTHFSERIPVVKRHVTVLTCWSTVIIEESHVHCIVSTDRVMSLTINDTCVSKQHWPVGVCNGGAVCLLWGGKCVSKYNSGFNPTLVRVGFAVDGLALWRPPPPSNPVFPCQYHSTIVSYSSSSLCSFIPEGKRGSLGTFHPYWITGSTGHKSTFTLYFFSFVFANILCKWRQFIPVQPRGDSFCLTRLQILFSVT